MTWNMMFGWAWQRLLDVFIIAVALAGIVFFFWAFGEAIAPYQDMYQMSRG